jgi:hypothetical protein
LSKQKLDPYTIRSVARWHNKRRRDLNWAGMCSTVPENRTALFAQAEAHENSAAELKAQAKALESATRKKASK